VTLADLTDLDTLTPDLRDVLVAAVRAGCNIVVSGAPAAGKTTLLRALAAEIPAGEHIVTVEEEYELGLHITGPQRLVTAMETRQPNAEGVGGIGLHTLLTQALRHSPSRVLVGEVRGGEVTALLAALSNGAAGGMCTLHARSAAAVATRVAQLAQLSDPPLDTGAAWRFLADAVDLIVHVGRDPADAGGRRYVTQVLEVGAVGDGGTPDTTALFAPDADGRATAAHTPSTGLRRRLTRAGYEPPPPSGFSLGDGRGATGRPTSGAHR
jgi:Flp pilus assembly CpaF family ATPase